jgi:2-oxoglutarate dehydrogenase E1 component
LWDDADGFHGMPSRLRPDDKIQRVVLCSGKVYYDLYEEREKRGEKNIQILRLEQLFPFPERALLHELGRFPNAEFLWCQEEPKNQGYWTFVAPNIEELMETKLGRKDRLKYAGRRAAASPAAGQMSRHLAELNAFLNDALSL